MDSHTVELNRATFKPPARDSPSSYLVDKIIDLAESLSRLQLLASVKESPNNPTHVVQIAPEIVDYVDDGLRGECAAR